jgi:hypothetical protein
MSCKVLKSNGEIEHRNSIRQLAPQEHDSEALSARHAEFDASATKALGSPIEPSDLEHSEGPSISFVTPTCEPCEDDEQPGGEAPDVDDFDVEEWDACIMSQVRLPKGDGFHLGVVRK